MSHKAENNTRQMFFVYFILLVVMLLSACAYRPKIVVECLPKTKQCAIVKESAIIPAAEKLAYVASWHGIPSGKLILEIKGIEKIDDHDYYHIVATAGPNSFFSIFYNIKYHVETYLDKDTGLPLKFYKKKSFKGKTTEETIVFDYKSGMATWEYTDKPKEIIKFNKDSQDLLSFLYYFRLKGLEPNKIYIFEIVYNGKIWPVEMAVGDMHLLKLQSGNCINVLSVKLSSSLISKIMGAQTLEAYVSADSKRIPVFFTTKSKIGQADVGLSNLKCLE